MVKAYSILSNTDKDDLKEIMGKNIEAIQKIALSSQYKEQNYSGDIKAGSVEFARFVNANSKNYGEGRKAGKGELLNNKGKVIVNLDQYKEIIEEINKNDIEARGIANIFSGRSKNHRLAVARELDRAFFKEAETAGKAITLKGASLEAKVEELIQTLETLTNEYVDGVDRESMVLFLNPKTYGVLRNYIDTTQNAAVSGAVEEMKLFHGVEVKSNTRQTEDAILMVKGSIAQPLNMYEYDMEKIGLSNDFALTLFFKYGTKALTPDLILKAKVEATASTTGK